MVFILLPLTLKTVRAWVSDPLNGVKKVSMKGIYVEMTADDGLYIRSKNGSMLMHA